MKIIHLLSQVELTGAEVYAILLSEKLMEKGHHCYLISDAIHRKTKTPFIPLFVHKAPFFRRIKNILFLRSFIRENSIDIINAHSRSAIRIGYWATRGLPCALVSTLHGKQHYSLSKKFFNIYGEKIIAVCENIKKQMIIDFNTPETKIQVIRNFFNFSNANAIEHEVPLLEVVKAIEAENKPQDATLIKKNIEPEVKFPDYGSFEACQRIISFLGRTSGPKGKNWEFIIENLVEKILKSLPNTKVQFAGGPINLLSEKVQKTIHQYSEQYGKRFEFIGYTSELAQVIEKSDIVIAAGRIAVEALLAGKKVLALGEQSYEGLCTQNTLTKNKASNFGDILPHHQTEIDWSNLENDVLRELDPSSNLNSFRNEINEIEKKLNDINYNDILSFKISRQDLAEYQQDLVVPEIIKIYQSALFKKNFPKNIPILMYHQVVEEDFESRHKIYVSKNQFLKHLEFFKKNKFSTITFKDLWEYKTNQRDWSEFPKKPLILTFDDGYENNFLNALPVLQKFQFKAVFYLLSKIHTYNFWDEKSGAPRVELMTSEQRKKLSATMEIGSHGFNHQKFSTMSPSEKELELKKSKEDLENELGQEIFSYAYTYGDRSPEDSTLCQKAGYKYAVNTTTGGFHFEDDPYSLFRVSIFPQDGPKELMKKTKFWYRKYYYIKRKE